MKLDERLFTESMYEDAYFKAFITNLGKYNEGELVGNWVDFPIDEDDFEEELKKIGIGSTDEFGQPYEEWFVTDYDCNLGGFDWRELGEYPSLESLNEYGEMIENIDDLEAVENALEVDSDLNRVLEGFADDDIRFYKDIDTDEDLGYMIVDDWYGGVDQLPREELERYFDYEKLGRELDMDTYDRDEPVHYEGEIKVRVTNIIGNVWPFKDGEEAPDDYEESQKFDDFEFTMDYDEEFDDEDTIRDAAEEEIENRYPEINDGVDDFDISFDYLGDVPPDYMTAAEYWTGDESASYDEIGEAFVNEVGMDGVGNPEYYFDYEAYGRDVAFDGFTFTSGGCIEWR